MSWLWSRFLALFAPVGYRFSFDPALRIVRRQLQSPDSRLIYSSTIDISRNLGWSEGRILEMPTSRDRNPGGTTILRSELQYPVRRLSIRMSTGGAKVNRRSADDRPMLEMGGQPK